MGSKTNSALLWRNILGVLRRRQFRSALRAARQYLFDRQETNNFDTKHGTDTGGTIPLWRLEVTSPNANFGARYETSDELELEEAFGSLQESSGELTFVDLGCGKGKMLMVAHQLGFRKIIGVEFVPLLAQIARSNLAKIRASNATVIVQDAAGFLFPDEDFVLYLFNPFSEEVMRQVVDHLRQSRAKKYYVIYNNARHARLFDSADFLFQNATKIKAKYPTAVWRRANRGVN